ncbi:MAG: ROK family transcriptional regulator [Verrucomicrobiota bacterium]
MKKPIKKNKLALEKKPPFSHEGKPANKMNRTMAARYNRETVLHLICTSGAISQLQIANFTQLRRSTIFYVLRDLRKRGLICDGQSVPAQRAGPKETLIEMAPNALWSAGLSLTSISNKLCILNAAGRIITQQTFPTQISVAKFLDHFPDHLNELMTRFQLKLSHCAGITVCLPGIINPNTGQVLQSNSLHLTNFALGEYLGKKLKCKIIVDRNVVCGAYAEKYLGGWNSAENFLYFLGRPETGNSPGKQKYSFGLTIVNDGKIYRGWNSASGELKGILDMENVHKEIHLDETTRDHQKEVSAFLKKIGDGIGTLINLLDPSLVIISGDDHLWSESHMEQTREAAMESLYPLGNRDLKIVRSSLGLDGIIHGAALLALHRGLKEALD